MSKKEMTQFSGFGYVFRSEHTYVSLLRGDEGECVELKNTRSRTVPNLFVTAVGGTSLLWTLVREIEKQLAPTITAQEHPDHPNSGRSEVSTPSRASQVSSSAHTPRSVVTQYAAYWQFFDSPLEARVVSQWRIRSGNRLADAVEGEILWLFTSGGKCKQKLDKDELPDGGAEDSQAHLTEVFTVRRVVPEVCGQFALLVEGVKDKCIGVCPPIPIDDIVRPAERDEDTPIGTLRQGSWRLPTDIADLLEKRLRQRDRSVYDRIFG